MKDNFGVCEHFLSLVQAEEIGRIIWTVLVDWFQKKSRMLEEAGEERAASPTSPSYLPLQEEDVHDGEERARAVRALGDDGRPVPLPGDPLDTVEVRLRLSGPGGLGKLLGPGARPHCLRLRLCPCPVAWPRLAWLGVGRKGPEVALVLGRWRHLGHWFLSSGRPAGVPGDPVLPVSVWF